MSAAWKYYCKLYLVITFVLTVLACIVLSFFDAQSFLTAAYTNLLTAYPDELEITLMPGSYTINQDLPYAIAMPESLQDGSFAYRDAIVFTTNELVSMGNITDYNAPIVLTEDRLYTVEEDGIRVKFFAEELNAIEKTIVINESLIENSGIQKITTAWWTTRLFYVPVFGIFFFIFAFIALLLWGIFTLVISSFFAWALYSAFAKRLRYDYGDILHISLYAITPILILKTVCFVLSVPTGALTWFALYLLWMLIIARYLLLPEKLVPKHVLVKSTVKISGKKQSAHKPQATSINPNAQKVALLTKSHKKSQPVADTLKKKPTATVNGTKVTKKTSKKITPTKLPSSTKGSATHKTTVKKSAQAKQVLAQKKSAATKKTTTKKASTPKKVSVQKAKTSSKKTTPKKVSPSKKANKKSSATKTTVKKSPSNTTKKPKSKK